jgi:hypothetical protein
MDNMIIEDIKKCNASDFIPNIQELSSYIQARKAIPVITNTERLLKTLRVLVESLIYYREHSPQKYFVKIEGKLYEIKLNGYSPDGNIAEYDLEEAANQIVENVICDISKSINVEIFKELIIFLNSMICCQAIPSQQKLSIIEAENKLPKNIWFVLIRSLPEKLAIETVNIRIEKIFKVLNSPIKYLPDKEVIVENIAALNSGLELYFKTQLRIIIANNHFDELIPTIIKALNDISISANNKFIDTDRLVRFLTIQLVLHNNLFLIYKREAIKEIVSEYSSHITGALPDVVIEGLQFDPESIELGSLNIRMHDPKFADLEQKDIKTVISFVVPYTLDQAFLSCDLKREGKIEFTRISNVFDDPVYSFLDSSDTIINGMPCTFFSDSIGNTNNSTRIDVVLEEFYHPDFDLVHDEVVYIDDKKEKAKRGGRYSPHKDLILETIWELQDAGIFPLQVKDLNSEFISNYLVSYFGSNNELIHHALFTITNFTSYYNAKNRFLTDLNSLYLTETAPDIKEFILDTKIYSRSAFLEFCYKLLEVSLKKSIEFGGLHSAFWKKDGDVSKPVLERAAQTIIYNNIRYLAEMKGVRVHREAMASDGSVDFHFSYTKNDKRMEVCVELKNAHHANIDHGINTQLPLYINDVGGREGIFLVLWHKTEEFDKPAKFSSAAEMEEYLNEINPTGYSIKSLVIDCTPKLSPSLKGSAIRIV